MATEPALPGLSRLKQYRSWVFDCDGVVLDSNRIKTAGFRTVALEYGAGGADALVAYHVANGGVSRFRKFGYFLEHVLGRTATDPEVEALARRYGEVVEAELLGCRSASCLDRLRRFARGAGWAIVSGGEEAQLRRVFDARGLAGHFDIGIFGSPSTKDEILRSLFARKAIELPALFLGDSRYDFEVADRFGLDFVFVSGWSDFAEWPRYCEERGIASVRSLDALCEGLA